MISRRVSNSSSVSAVSSIMGLEISGPRMTRVAISLRAVPVVQRLRAINDRTYAQYATIRSVMVCAGYSYSDEFEFGLDLTFVGLAPSIEPEQQP